MSLNYRARALGLSSGGLDSILAARVLQEQGVSVQWIAFETPFFSSSEAVKASAATGIPLRVMDITEEYMVMLRAPRAGYGKNMNPCMDCHCLMFEIAGGLMDEGHFDFLFSGEVVGQRPKSQNKNSMRYVEKHSGYDGRILRPLSAKLLPETDMEKKGLVDRAKLLDISGRSRKPQMSLAKELGIRDFPSPAGGCSLTDIGFSNRLRDLFSHGESCSKNELYLLSHGRHMRLDEGVKIVVGRDRRDNEKILNYYDPGTDTLIKMDRRPGPVVLITSSCTPGQAARAAAICAGYSKIPAGDNARVQIKGPDSNETVTVRAQGMESLKGLLV